MHYVTEKDLIILPYQIPDTVKKENLNADLRTSLIKASTNAIIMDNIDDLMI